MIHTLHLQNFKGIEAAELSLERFTVFVGPNASGKTSVLQALDLLSAFSNPQVDRKRALQDHGGSTAIAKNGDVPVVVRADGMWGEQSSQLHMELKAIREHTPWNLNSSLRLTGSWAAKKQHALGESESHLIEEVVRTGMAAGFAEEVPAELKNWRASILLRLESRRLAEPSYAESLEPTLDTAGAGLASALAQMALNRPEDFAELHVALRTIIPQVLRVRLSLAEVKRQETETLRIDEEPIFRHVMRSYSGQRVLLDTKSGTGIPSEAASEGTLLVLGLLTVLMNRPRPKLVLLDDLDRGLHPKAQRDLVTQLRKLLEQDPELQIIATSHSPYLVDHLDPKEVRLSTVLPDGTIRFAALTDHPDFERWKDEMRPGEFWSTVGENWVSEQKGEPTR